MNGTKNEPTGGNVVLRFTKGLLDKDSYRRIKEQVAFFSTGHKVFVMTVENDDADTLAKMVTPAAIFVDFAVMESMDERESTLHMLKRLSILTRQILSHYKTVTENPKDGSKTEADCRLSIVTPSAHIHPPENVSDKKYERCVREALLCARRLAEEGKSDMLIYYGNDGMLRTESKEDYVRRVYAGISADENENEF